MKATDSYRLVNKSELLNKNKSNMDEIALFFFRKQVEFITIFYLLEL